MGLLRFPRIARRPEYDGVLELEIGLEVYKLLMKIPYAGQSRVVAHTAQLLEENHRMHEAALDHDAGNGL